MMDLLNSFRGSGLLANPLYFVSVAIGLGVLVVLFQRRASERMIWAAAIALSALIATYVFIASDPSTPFKDFTEVYWVAGHAVLNDWENIESYFTRGMIGFVNLPILLFLFAPLGAMDALPAALVFFAIGFAAVAYAWWKIAELYQFSMRARVFSLFLTAAFGPLIYSMREDNSTHMLLVPLILAVVSLRDNKDMRAGVLLGLAALMKPILLILGVIAFLRGRFAIALGGFIVCAATALLSLLVFGWEVNLHWYESTIKPYTTAPLPGFNSQSIASSLARVERGPDAYWNYDVAPLSLGLRIALYASYAALLALLLWATQPWKQWRADNRAFEAEIMLAIILAVLVSTLSWTHYFVLALLPAAWLWRELQDKSGHRERVAFAAAYVLATPIVFYGARMGDGQFGPAFYLLGSHVCVAGLILFALLAKSRRALSKASA